MYVHYAIGLPHSVVQSEASWYSPHRPHLLLLNGNAGSSLLFITPELLLRPPFRYGIVVDMRKWSSNQLLPPSGFSFSIFGIIIQKDYNVLLIIIIIMILIVESRLNRPTDRKETEILAVKANVFLFFSLSVAASVYSDVVQPQGQSWTWIVNECNA